MNKIVKGSDSEKLFNFFSRNRKHKPYSLKDLSVLRIAKGRLSGMVEMLLFLGYISFEPRKGWAVYFWKRK